MANLNFVCNEIDLTYQEINNVLKLLRGQPFKCFLSPSQVTFVAVNCWWPYGSCKSRVKPPMYPIFVGHVLGREGVQFTGIQKLPEMRKFLKKLRNPFTYVQREEDVLALRAEDDVSCTLTNTQFS